MKKKVFGIVIAIITIIGAFGITIGINSAINKGVETSRYWCEEYLKSKEDNQNKSYYFIEEMEVRNSGSLEKVVAYLVINAHGSWDRLYESKFVVVITYKKDKSKNRLKREDIIKIETKEFEEY